NLKRLCLLAVLVEYFQRESHLATAYVGNLDPGLPAVKPIEDERKHPGLPDGQDTRPERCTGRRSGRGLLELERRVEEAVDRRGQPHLIRVADGGRGDATWHEECAGRGRIDEGERRRRGPLRLRAEGG